MSFQIVLISALRALIEVAGLMLLLRGAVWLAGVKARASFFYGLLTAGTAPFVRAARAASPRAIGDGLMPLVAFLVLLCLWILTGIVREWLCAASPGQCA
jgi:hypothetical protein